MRAQPHNPAGKWRFILLYGGLGFGTLFAALLFSIILAFEAFTQSVTLWVSIRALANTAPFTLVILMAGFYGWGCFQGWIMWREKQRR